MRSPIYKDDDETTQKAKYHLYLIQNLVEQFKEENKDQLKCSNNTVQK